MSDDVEIIRKIVWDWITESNDVGGVDAGDLAGRMEQAGFGPPPEE